MSPNDHHDPQQQQRPQQQKQQRQGPATCAATRTLLTLVAREVARDGGACAVTSLRDYVGIPARRLDALLTKSTGVGRPGLLTFLEGHPAVFRVDRTKERPHWVSLVLPGSPSPPSPSRDEGGGDGHRDDACGRLWEVVRQGGDDGDGDGGGGTPRRSPRRPDELREAVRARALYVLRKRQARLARRRRNSGNGNGNCNNLEGGDRPHEDEDDIDIDDGGVNLHWLLRQCCWDLHSYLRVAGFYLCPSVYSGPETVQPVGSPSWEPVVLAKFEETLSLPQSNRADREPLDDSADRGPEATAAHAASTRGEADRAAAAAAAHGSIRIQDGRAFLTPSLDGSSGLSHQAAGHTSSSIATLGRSDHPAPIENTREDQNPRPREGRRWRQLEELHLLREIDLALTDIVVRRDGGHQVSLQLVLHRYPDFKRLLGGRDLWKLYQTYSQKAAGQGREGPVAAGSDYDDDRNNGDNNNNGNSNNNNSNNNQSVVRATTPTEKYLFFSDVHMFQSGSNTILQSKRPKAIKRTSAGTVDGDDSDVTTKGRLKVDEEGLYSVANTKWGKAFANLLMYACRRTNLFGNDEKPGDVHQAEEREPPVQRERLAVDLTASVGGITLALARSNFFQRILAFEIDPVRARLCQENMLRHGFGEALVTVQNRDSVAEIPSLPRGACFVVDPPWGGYDYKRKALHPQQHGGNGGKGDAHYQFRLGDALLEDVLLKLAYHTAPCVVGLRLPVNYNVPKLLDTLRDNQQKSKVECITIRKVSVQLFVILYCS